MEQLEAKVGVRLSIYTGMLEYGHKDRMSTCHFYHAYPNGRLKLLDWEYEYAVALYSMEREEQYLYTYAYQENECWALFRKDSAVSRYQQEEFLFQEEGYFRVNVRRKDGKELDQSEAGHINQILSYCPGNQIPEGSPKEVKEWLKEEIQDTVEKIRKGTEEGAEAFLLLTDSHYTVNGTWEDTISAIRKVIGQSNLSGIVHLGDLTDGMVSRQVTQDYVCKVKQDLMSFQLPFYLVMGNHDTNYFANNPDRFSKEEQYWLYQSDCCEGVIREGHALYYYKDMPSLAIRVIFLHSFDEVQEMRYGFSEEEVLWFKKVLEELPFGYRVLVFSHVPPLPEIHFWNKNIRNGLCMVEILEGFLEKREGSVLGWIHGHNHADQVYLGRKFPIISLGCTKLEDFKDKKPEGAITPDRRPETISQELWNVLLLQKDSNCLRFIRFGAGEDIKVEK